MLMRRRLKRHDFRRSLTRKGPGRLLSLLTFFLLTVAWFMMAKVAFMVVDGGGDEITFGNVRAVICHGLSLDLSTALYCLIVPFLLSVASFLLPIPHRLYRIYYALIAVAFSLAFVVDMSLYPFWGFKLDASCLQYLATPEEAAASVSPGFIAIRAVGIVLLAMMIYWLYRRMALPMPTRYTRRCWPSLLAHLFLSPVIIIGIRGGLGESTTNIGQVYFSQNQFLNHAAVNPVFSFLASLEHTSGEEIDYNFMSEEECRQIMDAHYNTESVFSDTLLNTQRPDVVVVLLESAGCIFSDVMPHLNKISAEGVSFNCYGNSYRTDRGTVCVLSGYPSFPTLSVMKMPSKTRGLPSIARSLQREGYETCFLYGGDINFTNMRSYLVATGWETLTWKADYSSEEQNTAKWGVRDDITFATLYEMITGKHDHPFLIGYSTLSSHEPWDVPVHKYVDQQKNAFSYLDDCIGRLIDKLKHSPAWDNLLIVFTADHSINYKEFDEQHPKRNQVPMVWTGGAVKKARKLPQLMNQTDLAATLLGQMGLNHAEYTFSRDVMSRSYRQPMAIHTYNNGFSMVDSAGFTVYDLYSHKTLVGTGEVKIGKAYLQAIAGDLKKLGR